MKTKDSLIILFAVTLVVFAMYFIQVHLPKQIKDAEACYRIYLKK